MGWNKGMRVRIGGTQGLGESITCTLSVNEDPDLPINSGLTHTRTPVSTQGIGRMGCKESGRVTRDPFTTDGELSDMTSFPLIL